MLGSAFYTVFTPPWNRYCAATCQALIDLGFHAISDIESSRTVNVNAALRRIPATLDIIDWRSSRDLKPVDLLLTELIRQIQQVGQGGTARTAPIVGQGERHDRDSAPSPGDE
jgi:hypothetical protein